MVRIRWRVLGYYNSGQSWYGIYYKNTLNDEEGFLFYIDNNSELFDDFNKRDYIGPVSPETYLEYKEHLREQAGEKANKSKSKIITTRIGRFRSRSPIKQTKNKWQAMTM